MPAAASVTAESVASSRPRSNLQLRLLTASAGLPVLLAVIWIGGWPFALVVGTIALLASTEFVHGWLFPSMPIRAVLPQAPTFAVTAVMVTGVHADVRFAWIGLAFAALFAVLGYSRTGAFGPRRPYRVYFWCLGYIGAPMAAVILLRNEANGRDWILVGVGATFAVDTGAYAVGRVLGRHKMAPKISPKKTWEGAAGGLVAGVVAVLLVNAALDTGVSAAKMLPFALAAPPLAMIGDLAESAMKRRMGVKDASGLLPGHGGFLDRLDSLLFVLPALYIFLHVRVF